MKKFEKKESGVALVIVLLLLVVLTFIGYMALYSTYSERVIDANFRKGALAQSAGQSGVPYVVEKLYETEEFSGFSYPNDKTAPEEWAVHPRIGACVILQKSCGEATPSGSLSVDPGTICCFRTGPVYQDVYSLSTSGTIHKMKPYKPANFSDGALIRVPPPVGIAMAGTSDYFNLLFDFRVAGGGPGGSISEFEVMVKKGPYKGSSAGGTQYGSVTSANTF